MEYAKFLQDTAKEMAKEVQTSRSGDIKQTAEDLDEFLNKVYILSMLQSLPQLVMYCKQPFAILWLDNIPKFCLGKERWTCL